ncbi:MAG: hypothetical protein ACK5M3_05760, partial [Dysgonomonas sp.]
EIVAKAEAKGDLSGGLLLQLRFHTHVLNPYYEWVLIFSGLKGKFQAGVEVKNNNEDDIIDKAKDQETKDKTYIDESVSEEFTILDKSEYVIKRTYL